MSGFADGTFDAWIEADASDLTYGEWLQRSPARAPITLHAVSASVYATVPEGWRRDYAGDALVHRSGVRVPIRSVIEHPHPEAYLRRLANEPPAP